GVGIRTHNVKIPSGGLQKMGTISLKVLRPYNRPRVESSIDPTLPGPERT
ncbi:MAG: hypothetical protein SGVNAXEH_001031, partial [Holophagaceae bacterium]